MKRSILLFILATLAMIVNGQNHPKDYFLFPINPGQQNYLAGNMGEIRPNHFHAGLDIKTGGVEGVPVLAAADGFIHRVNVSSYGYGQVLYMSHPNGYRTTYAHLKTLAPKVAEWVRKKQYECERFSVELFPQKNQFAFKKGDTIAYSGNTGSSGGPHLHFEIRDGNDNVLNPLDFGFRKEVKDDVPPSIYRIALETSDINSRINNKLGRKEYRVFKEGGVNNIRDKVAAWGELALSLSTIDRLTGAQNQNGISQMVVCIDDKECFAYNNTGFAFKHNRSMNVHIDYETYRLRGSRFQNCYVEDGNKYSFYKTNAQRGRITINEERTYKISVDVYDIHGNKSRLEFDIEGRKPVVGKPQFTTLGKPQLSKDLQENTLTIKAKHYQHYTSLAKVYTGNYIYEIPVSYFEPHAAIYTWDMRVGIPDSIDFCGEMMHFKYKELVPARATFNYIDQNMKVYFSKSTLFDTLYLHTDYYENNDQEYWQVNDVYFPLYRNAYVTLKPSKNYNQEKAHAYATWGKGSKKYVGGTWKDGELKFGTKYLGKFTIAEDTKAPTVKVHKKGKRYLSFKMWEDMSGIKSFKATIDGKFILMNYDHKQAKIWTDTHYKGDWKGEFKLVVIDNANNQTVYTQNLY